MTALDAAVRELMENEKQWKAFNTRVNCATLAPPGSGKTKLLAVRAAWDLAYDISRPRGAACITLTNAAAGEISSRVVGLGVDARSSLFVGTVHSFARIRILRALGVAAGRREVASLGVATANQCSSAYDAAIRVVFGPNEDVSNVVSTMKFARQRLPRLTDAGWSRFGDKVRSAVGEYKSILRREGLTDYLGLVEDAVELVEVSQSVQEMLAAIYPRIYVDEYQDLAPGLDRLVRAICLSRDDGSTLFAVGDPDQAVFGFSGTLPDLLHDLVAHPKVECVELEKNYRSRQHILDAANRMRPERIPMHGDKPGGIVSAKRCIGGLDEQFQSASEQIQELHANGTPYDEIAVICPFNWQCDDIARRLRGLGVPVSARDNLYGSTLATTLVEELATWAVKGREASGIHLNDLLEKWRRALGEGWTRESEVLITRLVLEGDRLQSVIAANFFEQVLECGLESLMRERVRSDSAVELDRMRTALSSKLSGLSVPELAARAGKDESVLVTNMTLSKGLEFDVVIVLSMDEEICPYYKSLRNPEEMAEDRRKFYVALTRARNEVYFYYSGWIMKPWGDSKATGPSRFLRESGII